MEIHVHLKNTFPGRIGNRRITFCYNLWFASHPSSGPIEQSGGQGEQTKPQLKKEWEYSFSGFIPTNKHQTNKRVRRNVSYLKSWICPPWTLARSWWNPWPITIPQYRFNKTEQRTHNGGDRYSQPPSTMCLWLATTGGEIISHHKLPFPSGTIRTRDFVGGQSCWQSFEGDCRQFLPWQNGTNFHIWHLHIGACW